MIECMALNCNMKDKENEKETDFEKKKKKRNINIVDELNYLEIDDIQDSCKHYEENSVISNDKPILE